MEEFQMYNGSWVEDYLDESSTQLPGPTIASIVADNHAAVTWGSVAGVVAFLGAATGFLAAARAKIQAVDRVLSRIQSGLVAAFNFLSRRQQRNDASTSPMASPGVSGTSGLRNATDSVRIEMRGCRQAEGGRTVYL